MSIPLLFSKRGFHPRQLFSALQGAWLEPASGFIWQENTGITPTTTGGQTLGRIADQSGGGNNATQATAANRPVLGRRYNLLTYSEQFNNAAWNKSNCSITSTSVTDPLGGNTAEEITLTGSTATKHIGFNVAASSNVTLSVAAKAGTHTFVQLINDGDAQAFANFDLSTGVAGSKGANTKSSVAALGNGWYRLVATFNLAAVGTNFRVYGISSNTSAFASTTASTGTFNLWGADLRLTADVGKDPAYQRITTATDYDVGQYPAAIHDTTDSLVVSLPNLGGGVYSASGSVYFATPQGMSALHNQSMGTTYTLPALSTDIYSWIVVPQRLSTVLEGRLERYMLRKAGLAVPDYLTDDFGETITDDIGDPILAG